MNFGLHNMRGISRLRNVYLLKDSSSQRYAVGCLDSWLDSNSH